MGVEAALDADDYLDELDRQRKAAVAEEEAQAEAASDD
jgi:hypothetical protein